MKLSTDYQRVIPRDFFNEAILLKCMGQLALKILDCQLPDGMKIVINPNGEHYEPFDIHRTDAGYLHVNNYPVFVNGAFVFFGTMVNSRSPYPLICFTSDLEEIAVFDDSGNFTDEFASLKY